MTQDEEKYFTFDSHPHYCSRSGGFGFGLLDMYTFGFGYTYKCVFSSASSPYIPQTREFLVLLTYSTLNTQSNLVASLMVSG